MENPDQKGASPEQENSHEEPDKELGFASEVLLGFDASKHKPDQLDAANSKACASILSGTLTKRDVFGATFAIAKSKGIDPNKEENREIVKKLYDELHGRVLSSDEIDIVADSFLTQKRIPSGFPEGVDPTKENIVAALRNKAFSMSEIETAAKVAETRNEMRLLAEKMRIADEKYNADKSPEAKLENDKSRLELRGQRAVLEDKYRDKLREFKISYTKTELSKAEAEGRDSGFENKVQKIEVDSMKLINAEMMRWQDERVKMEEAIDPKGGRIGRFFKRTGEALAESKLVGGYFKMNRNTRTALTAAIIGGGMALAFPGVVALGVGGAGFVGIKVVRALVGGEFGYLLSKKIFQPLAEKALKHDREKLTERTETKAIEDVSDDLLHAVDTTSEFERNKILKDVADKNIALSEQYLSKLKKQEKWYKANRTLGTILAGLLGSRVGVYGGDLISKGVMNLADSVHFPSAPIHTPEVHSGMYKQDYAPPNSTTVDTAGHPFITPKINVESSADAYDPMKVHDSDVLIPNPKAAVSPHLSFENTGVVSPKISITPEMIDRATVGKGEGITHAIQRQLEVNPKEWGYEGDPSDASAVHAWSGKEAYNIAVDNEYINPAEGTEVRVLDLGPEGEEGNPAYVITHDSNGEVSVREFIDGKPSGGNIPLERTYEYTHDVSSDVSSESVDTDGTTYNLKDYSSEDVSDKFVIDGKDNIEEVRAGTVYGHQSDPSIPILNNEPEIAVEASPILEHEQMMTLFEKTANDLERNAKSFSSLSLTEQENVLYSQGIRDVVVQYENLKNIPASEFSAEDAKTLARLNTNFFELEQTFNANETQFIDSVKSITKMDDAGVDRFFNTKASKMWEVWNKDADVKAVNFMKSINMSPNEVSGNATIGEILRARFVNGEFSKTPIFNGITKPIGPAV